MEEPVKPLTIGNPAPPLNLETWFTGDEVRQLVNGQIYVVEFWATWCPPCRTSMPHLSELQDRFGEQVKFIGVTDEQAGIVEQFLGEAQAPDTEQTWRDAVHYSLANDPSGAVRRAYMEAAGQSGIPTAFIVGREGLIEWIGHPMSIDYPIEQVIAGTWDRAAELVRVQRKEALQAAIEKQDWDEAIRLIDATLAEGMPDIQLQFMKFGLLMQAQRTDEAYTWLDQITKGHWDDSNLLDHLAWTLTTNLSGAQRRLDVAWQLAERANELTSGRDASVLDTMARIAYERGDLDAAIAWQTKAVEAAGDDAKDMQGTLDRYLAERDEEGQAPEADAEPKASESPTGPSPD
jgi:thiol-disulfide isomerase/thioredoxin